MHLGMCCVYSMCLGVNNAILPWFLRGWWGWWCFYQPVALHGKAKCKGPKSIAACVCVWRKRKGISHSKSFPILLILVAFFLCTLLGQQGEFLLPLVALTIANKHRTWFGYRTWISLCVYMKAIPPGELKSIVKWQRGGFALK